MLKAADQVAAVGKTAFLADVGQVIVCKQEHVADKIAVMDKDGLKEFGTYDELMAKKGAFYQLNAMA